MQAALYVAESSPWAPGKHPAITPRHRSVGYSHLAHLNYFAWDIKPLLTGI